MSMIRTTHTGSLHRPREFLALARREDVDPSGRVRAADDAVAEVVRHQVDLGIDIVNDGEAPRVGYATYVKDRLAGFDGTEPYRPRPRRDLDMYPDFARFVANSRPPNPERRPACTGPLVLRDPDAVHHDIARLKAAAEAAGVGVDRLFLSAASPGVVAFFFGNQHYPTQADYLVAIAEAMTAEYRAIVEAGITLQLDCPDFAMGYSTGYEDLSIEEFRREVAFGVEVLNTAIAGLDPEKMRIHVCWGNAEAPHTHDVDLRDIIDVLLTASPNGLSIEASNPRHAHEWQVFEDVALPDGKYILPGVLDTTTNFVEHPELIAQRLRNFTRLLGNERVVASTDCGFGTFAGREVVVEDVAWGKLEAMIEGARLASATS